MNQPLKLFVQAYCSCGTSAYIPIKTETVNHLTIDNSLRSGGWKKIVLNGNEDWICKKCNVLSQLTKDPQEAYE